MKINVVTAKVGLENWMIVFYPRCQIKVGRRVTFRRAVVGDAWLEGVIESLEPLTIRRLP